ncbi:MAG: type VI secretion system-associated FHA domain protein TagH [Gammaproteobacteria bacterium]|nr:type VI secretion system-associated FHA domain protein TagH [Gammaproteobacteria bacterium]
MPLILRVTSHQKSLLSDDSTFVFDDRGGSIGRSLDSDWVLPDPSRYVSSKHALVRFHAGEYFLTDTSTNGVYLNLANEPIGRGRQHHLSDGDRLRLGDYEIIVSIAGADMTVPHGGGVGREHSPDLSVDPVLLAEMNDSINLEVLLEDDPDLPSGSLPALRKSRDMPAPAPQATDAVSVLLRSAGLDPASLPDADRAELMHTAGQMLREIVIGLKEILHNRADLKDRFRLSQTTIQPGENNPLKFSASADEALYSLLRSDGGDYLSPVAAIHEAFDDIRIHQAALLAAMSSAFDDFVERLHPEELKEKFDRGLKRGALLGATNKMKYWDLYGEVYQAMTQKTESSFPHLFSEEFTRAYEAEIERLKASPS